MGSIQRLIRADKAYFRDCRPYIDRQNCRVLQSTGAAYLLILLLFLFVSCFVRRSMPMALICCAFLLLQAALLFIMRRFSVQAPDPARLELCRAVFEISVLAFFLLEALLPFRNRISIYFPFPIILLVIMFTYRPRRALALIAGYCLLFAVPVCFLETGETLNGDLWMALGTFIASLAGYVIAANLRHETGAALRFRAERDPLTGLYNREGFCLRAAELLQAHEPGYYVVACLDITSFKVVNDQYGLAKGDALLRYVGDTLQVGFEAIGGVACRVMADKFAVLYPHRYLDSAETAEIRRQAGLFSGTLLPISFSIGRYVADDLSLSVSAMYDRAAIAQSSVKGRADVRIALYDESMRKRLLHEQEISGEMRIALEGGHFEVWFQPQYNHSSGALIGAEALVRWRHPVKGMIQPADFIPVFERSGFIYELDQYVWRQVCIFLRKWLDAGRSPLPVSVNISRHDVLRADFFSVITRLVESYRIPVKLLRLEITESAFAASSGCIIEVVKQLIAYGFTMEIDDFGSGYSSLNTLKDVPAHVLKLDMRFLENTAHSQRGGNILESVVRMARWLGMSVIAEGVETLEQANYLKSIGCVYVQGFLYGRPMPVEAYETLAAGAGKEERLLALETVETLDNSAFWDPKSMDTLIFNTYVGGACIFEYHEGRVETLRANDKFAEVLAGEGRLTVEEALRIPWAEHMDAENRSRFPAYIRQAVESRKELVFETQMRDLPGCPVPICLRILLRMIASAGDRYLFYCTGENITAQRDAERKARVTSERLQAIMDNAGSGITAVVVHDGGSLEYVFVNDRFYQLLGYTRAQYDAEVDSPFSRVHPDDSARVRAEVDDVNRTGQTATLQFRLNRRDGREIVLRAAVSLIRFADVEQPVQLSVFRDVTEERRAVDKLRETDEQLRFLNDTAHDLLAQTDANQGIERVLRKLQDYFAGSRAYIFEFDRARSIADNTYEICRDGVTSEKANLQNVPLEKLTTSLTV